MHRRGAARRNMMHGWPNGPRKRRDRRQSSSNLDRRSPGEEEMMMLENRALRIVVGIFFAVFVVPAFAHDPSHPELNDWFNRLSSKKPVLLIDRRRNRSRSRLGIKGRALSRPSRRQ